MATWEDLQTKGVDKLQVMPWGEPGSGKTILAHSFPRPRTLDFDNGLRSVSWAVKQGLIPKPEGWVYETIHETRMGRRGFVEQATAFDKACDYIDKWLKESDQWDTLIIDSLTAFNQYAINKALENMDELGASKSLKESKSVAMQIIKIQDYGGAMTLFTHFMDWVRSFDKNLVCVAHSYEQVDKEGTLRKVQPMLIGQLRQRIVKDFDEVWFCDVSGPKTDPKFTTQTKSDGLVTAKSRLGVFDAKEPLLTYQRVLEKLKAAKHLQPA